MPIRIFSILLLCLALTGVPLMAQNSGQNSQPAPHDEKKDASPAQKPAEGQNIPGSSTKEGKTEGTSNDRLFFTLPNFLTLEHGGKVPPMTAKEKFAVVARSSFDYVQYPWYAFLAGISQAENSEPGFGQGAAGYGKRFGSALADGTIENFMTGAILPSLLHQDPRFYQSGRGGFVRRTGYAVSRMLVTRGDSGHSQFNFSEILGSAMSASISTNTYHPTSRWVSTPTGMTFIKSDRTLENTASVWVTQLGYDTMTLVIREFWPDIHRKLAKKDKPAP